MIEKISMKSVATYDATGVDIDTNRKINFFFGYNGSGKSTIGRYLHDINLPSVERNLEFANCSQQGFNPTTETILVYNEDFRNDNFILKDEQRGIFSLNKTNDIIDTKIKETANRVDWLKKCKNGSEKRCEELKKKQADKLRALEELVFEKRSLFATCKNATIPNKGSKKAFLNGLRAYLTHDESVKSLPELLQEYNRVYTNELRNIPYVIDTDNVQSLIDQEKAISDLLNEVIVGNKDVDIAALIDQLGMSSWVEQGVSYMEKSGDLCPFCQRPFDDKNALQQKFEHFFDKSYKTKIEDLRSKAAVYYTGLDNLLKTLNEIVKQFNPENKLSSVIGELVTLKDGFVKAINEKKEKPNEKKTIGTLALYLERLVEIKSLMLSNNQDYANLSGLQNQWVKDVQKFIVEKCRFDIERHDRWYEKSENVLKICLLTQETLQGHIEFLLKQIDELRKHTVNTADAVNNIRKILRNVGFDGFEIIEKTSSDDSAPTYYLKRNGSTTTKVYKSLSEGEKTFISFLYFHQLCLGTDDIEHGSSKKKIIVIDDPVSSLDSKVMFVITTLIHQLAKYRGNDSKPNRQEFANPNIEQIFILTHNFYFYKEVSFEKRPINTNHYHHIIEKVNSVSKVTYSGYDRNIENDYSMMWKHLKRTKTNIGTDKAQNLMIANTMRRVIDTYIDFVGIKKSGDSITWSAIDSFNEGSPEYIVESAFISLINDESHSISALDDVYYESIVRQEPAVIFNAFKALFKQIGPSHYENMMEEEYDS